MGGVRTISRHCAPSCLVARRRRRRLQSLRARVTVGPGGSVHNVGGGAAGAPVGGVGGPVRFWRLRPSSSAEAASPAPARRLIPPAGAPAALIPAAERTASPRAACGPVRAAAWPVAAADVRPVTRCSCLEMVRTLPPSRRRPPPTAAKEPPPPEESRPPSPTATAIHRGTVSWGVIEC